MKRFAILSFALVVLSACHSDNLGLSDSLKLNETNCVSGDCENGYGRYNDKYGVYEGEWLDGKYNGNGLLLFSEGDIYKGEFKDGEFCGEGEYKSITNNWHYKGNWKKGKFSGKGIYVCPAGNTYNGDYLNDLRNGYGAFVYKIGSSITKAIAGDKYFGEWKEDDYYGWGILVHKDGSSECGIWEDGIHLKQKKSFQSVINYLNTKYSVNLSKKEIMPM
jgi:hypothetical protein